MAGAALLFTSGLTHAAKTVYPLTIKNCGRDITFNKAPERVATVGQNSTEILYSLGLAERVVGTSLWFGPVPDAYKAANEKVAVIAQNIPSFEGIIAKKPDLVASQFEWQIGPAGTVASYEQFSELNVPVYTAPADCAKDNEDGGDGVRKGMFDIAMVYQEVSDLAKIFDVQDKGDELIASLKARVPPKIKLPEWIRTSPPYSGFPAPTCNWTPMWPGNLALPHGSPKRWGEKCD